ncbi:MAG: DNA-processing protein DprA [Clostridia bacterium]|nr:DNA-processing protein DprA [Clostridia bacterium]
MTERIDKRAYWIWLQHAFTPGSSKPRAIFNRFGNIKEFYDGGAALWAEFRFITDKEVSALYNYTIKHAQAALDYAESLGQHVITPECKEYPECLWNIKDPPAVLYIQGKMPDVDHILSIAIVGSRKAKPDSLNIANRIAYDLSKSGTIVISGGAMGIDAEAHKGSMMGISPTICVLGCGLDVQYLMKNEHMRRQVIEKGGALITEYPPGTQIQRGTFQARNRIISGLSKGVLIVCAGWKSGTMITAKRAVEQDRVVFAVPGSPAEETSYGPNSLIKDGAVPVTNAEDILHEYEAFYDFKTDINVYSNMSEIVDEPDEYVVTEYIIDEDDRQVKDTDVSLSENGRKVLEVLTAEPQHISEVAKKTGLKTSLISAAMTELEILGLATDFAGKRYALKK